MLPHQGRTCFVGCQINPALRERITGTKLLRYQLLSSCNLPFNAIDSFVNYAGKRTKQWETNLVPTVLSSNVDNIADPAPPSCIQQRKDYVDSILAFGTDKINDEWIQEQMNELI